jgi:hypothetical protein
MKQLVDFGNKRVEPSKLPKLGNLLHEISNHTFQHWGIRGLAMPPNSYNMQHAGSKPLDELASANHKQKLHSSHTEQIEHKPGEPQKKRSLHQTVTRHETTAAMQQSQHPAFSGVLTDLSARQNS